MFLRLLKNILDIVCDAATKVNQQGVNDDEDEFEEIKEGGRNGGCKGFLISIV